MVRAWASRASEFEFEFRFEFEFEFGAQSVLFVLFDRALKAIVTQTHAGTRRGRFD